MTGHTLYIGNKNYSSWSLRPWILMRRLGFQFNEQMVEVSGKGVSAVHKPYSPSGLVPCLHVTSRSDAETAGQPPAADDYPIWDSLAITEYLHDTHPEKGVWPKDVKARARARCIANEMHSGFGDVRGSFPMNVKLRMVGADASTYSEALQKQIARIEEIWTDARTNFADKSAGPYLFGAFSAADAMYAPIVFRFHTYNVKLSSPEAIAYVATMLADPAMAEWEAGALAETNPIVHYDEFSRKAGGADRVVKA